VKTSAKKVAYEKKVREYARALKDDEDWDWAFIIKLLQYKLKRTRLCIESNNIVASSKQIAKQIKQVVDADPFLFVCWFSRCFGQKRVVVLNFLLMN